MKFNKYLLVVVDYDSETLEVHCLEDDGEVYEYFTSEVADNIIKDKKFKGAFEEAILLEVDVDSYFKGNDMKDDKINKLKEALDILKEHTKNVSSVLSDEGKCIVTVFDRSEPTMYTETFNSKEEFLERFEDDEQDCEGFSWLLWEEGSYNRLTGNGCYYHLTKLTDI